MKKILFAIQKSPFFEILQNDIQNLNSICDVTVVNDQNQFDELGERKFKFDGMCLYMPSSTFGSDILRQFSVQTEQQLKWVHSLTTGVDSILTHDQFIQNDSIILTNAKGAFSTSLAEYVLLGILYHSKHLEILIELKKNNQWKPISVGKPKEQTLGIIGVGDIGTHVAKTCKNALGMKIIGIKNDINNINEDQKKYLDVVYQLSDLKEVLKQCDYVCNVLPLTKQTYQLFNADIFKFMKKDAIFMNIGRGKSVVEQDLIQALQNKIIKGAVLDVFENEPLNESSLLWSLPNVLITSHCADLTEDYVKLSYNIFKQNLDSFISNQAFKHQVNKKLGY